MTRRDRLTLTVCVLLHVGILWNVCDANKHTPRIIQVVGCGL
jgi:hypothetical protein